MTFDNYLRRSTLPARGSGGFTLLEMLACAAILLTIAALLFPTVSRSVQRARETECGNRMKQLGSAFHLYAAENDGKLPTQLRENLVPITSADSWTAKLLPYAESFKIMCCANSAKFHIRVPNSYLYNGWVSLCNGDRNDASNHNPKGLDAVRITSSRQPSRDVLVIDNFSMVGSYAMLDASAAGQANPVTATTGNFFPHPMPKNNGYSTADPGSRRNILFVDGHVETRMPVAGQEIQGQNWRWPVQ